MPGRTKAHLELRVHYLEDKIISFYESNMLTISETAEALGFTFDEIQKRTGRPDTDHNRPLK